MKVKELKKALQRINKFVGKEVSTGYLDNGWLTVAKSKTDWISVKIDLFKDAKGLIDFTDTLPIIVNSWPGDITIKAEMIGSDVKLTTPIGFAALIMIKADAEPPKIVEIDGFETSLGVLDVTADDMELLKKARLYCATEKEVRLHQGYMCETRWASCVCLHEDQVAATNGNMLFFDDLVTGLSGKMLLRSEALDAFDSNPCRILCGDYDRVEIHNDDVVVGFKQPGFYPNWKSLVPTHFNTIVTVPYKALLDVVKQTKGLGASYFKMIVHDGFISAHASNLDASMEYHVNITEGVTVTGDGVHIGIGAALLERMLKADKTDTVVIDIVAPDRPMVINGHSILMPVIIAD